MSSLPIYALSMQQNGVVPSEYPILPGEYARREKSDFNSITHSLSCKNCETLLDPYRTLNRISSCLRLLSGVLRDVLPHLLSSPT